MSDVKCKNDVVFVQAAKQGWPAAQLVNGELEFSTSTGFEDALRSGFFFIKHSDPEISLAAGDDFARNFYLGSSPSLEFDYREVVADKVGAHQGYFSRVNDQTEQFFLESRNWDRFYPENLCMQAREMRDFAIAILAGVLDRLPVPPNLIARATGGALTEEGTHTLTFNHFRPEIHQRGLNVHKDSGWVTLLRSPWPGLEVEVEGEWRPINPIQGSLVVNFGCAFEILTRSLRTPVKAASHRVVRQQIRSDREDRFSYALFVDSSLSDEVSEGLFEISERGDLKFVCDFKSFLKSMLENTYDRDTEGLY